MQDRCHVVAIVGIGGMGKTTLAAQCIRELASQDAAPFDALYWRSLVNAPPLGELLPPLLQALSQQQLTHIPENVDEQLRLLLGYLRERRVLLVLDNMESILEAEAAGVYRAGYAPYGQLLHQFATLEYQSHLLLTSRERPRGYERLERDGYPVRSLQLAGLDDEAGHQLFRQRGVLGDDDQETHVIERYSGNPLALKLVADTVDDLFGGDMAEFLADDTLIFDDIRTVLDQHFARLTRLEQDILFWLAIEREQVELHFLHTQLLQAPPMRVLIEALNSLRRRALIERQADGLSLQNVITEYLSERFIEIMVHEICTGSFDRLHTHPLITTQAKQYIRQSQERLLLQPVAERVAIQFRTGGLAQQMHLLLAKMRTENSRQQSYAGGTILNVLLYLGVDLSGFDFSQIPIRQAYLQGYEVHGANFSNAMFEQTVFTNTFGAMLTLSMHPDGDILATGTADGDVQLWQVADGQLTMQIRGHTDSVMSVAFAPDGQILATAGRDRLIHLWHTQTGQLRQTLCGHTMPLRSIVFSPDGKTLVSAGEDSEIHLWDVESATSRCQLSEHVRIVCAVALSPDGQTLASGGEDNIVRLWDMQTGQLLYALHGHAALINALCFSPDGQTLASAGGDQLIHLWDVESGRELERLTGHQGRIRAITYSPDGKLFASGSEDTTIRLWHVERQAYWRVTAAFTVH